MQDKEWRVLHIWWMLGLGQQCSGCFWDWASNAAGRGYSTCGWVRVRRQSYVRLRATQDVAGPELCQHVGPDGRGRASSYLLLQRPTQAEFCLREIIKLQLSPLCQNIMFYSRITQTLIIL